MKIKKDITIYDIAKKLGLASSTISRGLQNNPAINIQTRKKIQNTAKELGYQRNPFASNLRKQQTNTIGVIVHELNSNFITSVLYGIEKIITEAGYNLIIAHSNESFEKEAANADNLFHKRVDGVIASLSLSTKGLDHFRKFEERGIPIIFFDRVEEKLEGTKVIIDNYYSGLKATQHLIDQGSRRIVLITSNLNRNVYFERWRGYKEALDLNKIAYDPSLVFVKDLSKTYVEDSANTILQMKEMPDGAFITNDFLAAVFMRKMKENGVRVPEDMTIIGFNNDPISTLVEPALSTIDYPGQDMGEIAARNIVEHLQGKSHIKNTNTIVVRSELIIRNSSLRCNS